jgi:hypothetical protein
VVVVASSRVVAAGIRQGVGVEAIQRIRAVVATLKNEKDKVVLDFGALLAQLRLIDQYV